MSQARSHSTWGIAASNDAFGLPLVGHDRVALYGARSASGLPTPRSRWRHVDHAGRSPYTQGIDQVLEANLEISTALPCRISVYEEAGKIRLATIKPTALIGLYPNPELKGVAEEVENDAGADRPDRGPGPF